MQREEAQKLGPNWEGDLKKKPDSSLEEGEILSLCILKMSGKGGLADGCQ